MSDSGGDFEVNQAYLVKQREPRPNDASTVMRMLSAHYGAAPPNTTLGALRRRNPQLDRFDWLLLVIAIEIDLKVRLPARLIEAERKTLGEFAGTIASLPKVDSADHTLEMLTLLSQALTDLPLVGHGPNLPSKTRRRPPAR